MAEEMQQTKHAISPRRPSVCSFTGQSQLPSLHAANVLTSPFLPPLPLPRCVRVMRSRSFGHDWGWLALFVKCDVMRPVIGGRFRSQPAGFVRVRLLHLPETACATIPHGQARGTPRGRGPLRLTCPPRTFRSLVGPTSPVPPSHPPHDRMQAPAHQITGCASASTRLELTQLTGRRSRRS